MASETGDVKIRDGYLVTLSGKAWGLALALLCGLGLFLATVVLVLRGGEDQGAHLGLLSQYLPGYDVTWFGAILGFVYAFIFGYVLGRVICFLYNRITRLGAGRAAE